MVLIKLMEHEHRLKESSPPSVVSFYTKNEATHPDDVIFYLCNRFGEILKANPWLTGRLVKQKNGGQTDWYLLYEEPISSTDDYFSVVSDDLVFTFRDWIPLIDYLSTFIPKKGSECIDKDERLVQLIVFQNHDRTKLAAMFSLNHVIGDGFTLYHIWKMLDKDQLVERLVAERNHNMMVAVQQKTNLQPLSCGALDIKVALGLFGRGLWWKLCGNAPPNKFIYRVNSAEIQKQKAIYNTEASFVSTNDILCTWFFTLCEPKEGLLMDVNVRDRIPELHRSMAGNYIASCPINFTDIETAKDFRNKWTGILKKEIEADETCYSNISSDTMSLYHQVELPGYSHYIHLPVFNQSDFWDEVFGIPVASQCWIYPFCLNKDEVGVVLCAHNDVMTEEYFNGCEILGDKISILKSPGRQQRTYFNQCKL